VFSIWTLLYTKRILKINPWKLLLVKNCLVNFQIIVFHSSPWLTQSLFSGRYSLGKLTNPTMRNFIEKYIQHKMPDNSVFKNDMKQCYNLTVENIRDKIQDNFIYLQFHKIRGGCLPRIQNKSLVCGYQLDTRLWGTVYCKKVKSLCLTN
jgi:hypothetical protein